MRLIFGLYITIEHAFDIGAIICAAAEDSLLYRCYAIRVCVISVRVLYYKIYNIHLEFQK